MDENTCISREAVIYLLHSIFALTKKEKELPWINNIKYWPVDSSSRSRNTSAKSEATHIVRVIECGVKCKSFIFQDDDDENLNLPYYSIVRLVRSPQSQLSAGSVQVLFKHR